MKKQYLEYSDGNTVLEAYCAYDESRNNALPAVLVAHDWSGRRDLACQAADNLAELGYVGFALDMYGKGVFGKAGDAEGNAALMAPFASDRLYLRRRIQAAVSAVRQLPFADEQRIAAIGYCFGGMCVLELARSGDDIRGVVSVHGILSPGDAPTKNINSKVLCLHGHDDPMARPEDVLELEKELSMAGADWQIHVYGGTVHAFTNPAASDPDFGTVYNPTAAARAKVSIQNFLVEIFM